MKKDLKILVKNLKKLLTSFCKMGKIYAYAWAAQQGYSTFLWNYDPNQQTASDTTAASILTAYNAAA